MYILQNVCPIFSESFRIIDNILANNGTINFNRKTKENILSFSIHIIRYSHTNTIKCSDINDNEIALFNDKIVS